MDMKLSNWNLSYNNLYMHKKQYIYENTLNPKSTQFIFPYIKCSRIFHFLTKCFPYQNFKIIDINLSYLSASVPNGETFELEHIIARKRIDAADSSRPRHILGNSLGNCMYLPRGINNPKKDKTLYEINDHNRYSQLIKESQYFSEDEMQKAMQALTASDYESVNGLLRERSRQVAHTLVRALLKDSV